MMTVVPVGPPARPRRGRPAVLAAVALAALALLVPTGCSGDDDGTTTTTSSTAPAREEGDGEQTPDDDPDGEEAEAPDPDDEEEEGEEGEEAAPPTTEALPDDAVVYGGTLDGREGTSIAFGEVDGVIPSFTVTGLTVDCFPLEGGDEVPSRAVNVTMTDIEVSPEGFVDHGEPDQPWSPLLVGTFTPDGEFAGNLEVNRRADGAVCGGEFTFTAPEA
jgi:hypothetical protein